MFNTFLETMENIIAPNPTNIQEFEFNWKLIKGFYTNLQKGDKTHINDTKLPFYLDQMLQILIKDEAECKESAKEKDPKKRLKNECIEFVLENKPLDILVDLAISEKPVGCRQWIFKWIKRYLTCIENPEIQHGSVFKPIQKLLAVCNGNSASPYEIDEILFLEAVAGLIGKDPELIKIFIPSHQHLDSSTKGVFNTKTPKDNKLFDEHCTKIEPNIRRVSLMLDEDIEDGTEIVKVVETTPIVDDKFCNCDEGDRFLLLDVIMSYFESADSTIVVRACEGALILTSLKDLNENCVALNSSITQFSHLIAEKVFTLAEQIPEDMDLGDIEEAVVAWGLFPKDNEQHHFIGRYQLTSFLCWLDYADCLMRDNFLIGDIFGFLFREQVLEKIVEPNLLEVNAQFGLVLTAKIIKQVRSEALMDEIANWLVGCQINGSDCLLSILIENAQENPDNLLQTLQFVEALLDNPNERMLHSMIFFYVNTRGYYDYSRGKEIESWSDEEESREKRRGSIEDPIRSKTLAPNNILKIINNFLLLLPRQLMDTSIGTCYENYMLDASRHYALWIKKTQKFNWPVEAASPSRRNPMKVSPSTSLGLESSSNMETKKQSVEYSDSGISEDSFYEGPLLRLLFSQIKNMGTQQYELNLAVIAILSKLALLPQPYLHEILLSTEIPVSPGATTLFTVITELSKKLLSEIPRIPNFEIIIKDTAKRLLSNPTLLVEEKDAAHKNTASASDPLFEALIVLEEFCKELAAIAFIKYHHATE